MDCKLAELEAWARTWAWYTPLIDFIKGNYWSWFGPIVTVGMLTALNTVTLISIYYYYGKYCDRLEAEELEREREEEELEQEWINIENAADRAVQQAITRNVIAALTVRQQGHQAGEAPIAHRAHRQAPSTPRVRERHG